MLSDKSQAIVLERDRGDTLVEIAERHQISHQRVSQIAASASEFVTGIELDLMVAKKTDEACAYLIPYGPDYTNALGFGDWIIRRLRARGLTIKVTTRRAANGIVLVFDDVTDYSRSST